MSLTNLKDNRFYVYEHVRADTKEVFYVGKGTGRRAWQKTRNKYWKRIVAKTDYKINIVFSELTQLEAIEKEIELTKFYKSKGECKANIVIGSGSTGRVMSLETKSKISIKSKSRLLDKNNHPRYKHIMNKDQKDKISKSLISSGLSKGHKNPAFKGNYLTPMGIFDSLKEAAIANKMSESGLWYKCKRGKNSNFSFKPK